MPAIKLPAPVMAFAMTPKTKGDEDKVFTALRRLQEEDPTIDLHRDPQTGEQIVAGLSQMHVEVIVDRLRDRFGAEVELKPPRVPYQETIRKPAKAHGRHKKQSGGRGQFGDCHIAIEPLDARRGLRVRRRDQGRRHPELVHPGGREGRASRRCSTGPVAGFPVKDVRVRLQDGQYHSVDSSEQAFRMAGSMAMREAMAQAGAALLEPIMLVTLSVPEESVGDVIGDLNSRRGRPQGMEPAGLMTEIKAEVPMAEMLTYAPDLRALTGGQGDYTMEFLRYEEVPAHLAQKVVGARAREEEGAAGLSARPPTPRRGDAQVDHHLARRRRVRRVRPDAAARRARRRLPRRRLAAHGLRAVHGARDARGLDPRGAGPRAVAPRRRRPAPLAVRRACAAARAATATAHEPLPPRGGERLVEEPAGEPRRARAARRAGARQPAYEPPREPRHVHAVPTNAELKMSRALELFNGVRAPAHGRRRRPLARRAARRRAPVGDRGQRRRHHRRVGALVVPLRGRPGRRGGGRARHRAGHRARRARRGRPHRERRRRRAWRARASAADVELPRAMIYCVVPQELAPELYEKLADYYADDPNVEVIIDRRKAERRDATATAAASARCATAAARACPASSRPSRTSRPVKVGAERREALREALERSGAERARGQGQRRALALRRSTARRVTLWRTGTVRVQGKGEYLDVVQRLVEEFARPRRRSPRPAPARPAARRAVGGRRRVRQGRLLRPARQRRGGRRRRTPPPSSPPPASRTPSGSPTSASRKLAPLDPQARPQYAVTTIAPAALQRALRRRRASRASG